jgi:Dyp-type peroxidase family
VIGTTRASEPVLAVDEIQGNVLPGFNSPHQVLLGVRFDAPCLAEARRWLAALVPTISTLAQVQANRQLRRASGGLTTGPVQANVAFDVKGLTLLAPATTGAIRDRRFLQGMGVESGLGDPQDPARPGHPTNWVVGGTPANTPEAMLLLGGDDLDDLRRAATTARAAAVAAGLDVSYEQEGHALDGGVEHFGFRDGISSPGARGRLSDAADDYLTRRVIDPADDRAVRFGRPGQPLVWPGQFVLGYPRQRPDDPVAPGPVADGGHPWMDNGSYLVFRRLRQDVAAFRRFVTDEAARLAAAGVAGLTAERLAAVMVGRWPKGTALVRNPAGDDADPMADRATVNHFGFAAAAAPIDVEDDPSMGYRTVTGAPADRLGRICPGFAHVRKVNPRDLPTDQGGMYRTLTFAILRRGIPFGDPYAAAGERGLLFLCYQTSIQDQFEVLNSSWMNRVNGPEGDSGQDLLVGQGSGPTRARSAGLRSTTPGGAAVPIVTLTEWVIPTGGGYFFAPSLSALRQFAAVGALP